MSDPTGTSSRHRLPALGAQRRFAAAHANDRGAAGAAAAFVVGIEIARPGTVNAVWISNMALFAAPLGIMAAGQTLVMLTGGIDLSVASVATASAYLMASHSALGGAWAVLYGLASAWPLGLINGVGIALLSVQPLVMTLGTGLMTEGMLVVYSQKTMANAPHRAAVHRRISAPENSWAASRTISCSGRR